MEAFFTIPGLYDGEPTYNLWPFLIIPAKALKSFKFWQLIWIISADVGREMRATRMSVVDFWKNETLGDGFNIRVAHGVNSWPDLVDQLHGKLQTRLLRTRNAETTTTRGNGLQIFLFFFCLYYAIPLLSKRSPHNKAIIKRLKPSAT